VFFIIFPLTFVNTSCSTHCFTYTISLVINELSYLFISIGPEHFTILAMSLAVFPKPLLLPAITPLHDTLAVHDVCVEGTYLF